MIEPDFAEFVDDQRAVCHPRLVNEAAQQRRLSTPEKSGDEENRNAGSVVVAVELHPRHLAPPAAIGDTARIACRAKSRLRILNLQDVHKNPRRGQVLYILCSNLTFF